MASGKRNTKKEYINGRLLSVFVHLLDRGVSKDFGSFTNCDTFKKRRMRDETTMIAPHSRVDKMLWVKCIMRNQF